MQTIKRILVVIDPTKDQQIALTRALQLAGSQPLEIMLYCCVYYPVLSGNHFLSEEQSEQSKKSIIHTNQLKLDNLVAAHNSAENVLFHTQVEWRDPIYTAIILASKAFEAELLIKSSHKHSAITRTFFNSTDIQLLKASAVPVLFVKTLSYGKDAKIMAALDPFDELSQKGQIDNNILELAYRLSNQARQPLHACHCFDPSYWEVLLESVRHANIWTDVFPANSNDTNLKVLDNLRLQHNQKFAQECAEFVPDSANQHLVSGELVSTLAATVEKLGVGTLVAGTSYRTGFLGSSAEELLEELNCDLLVVKPKDFESPV
jgi:universal stress protein E